jgi:hypothetical protein
MKKPLKTIILLIAILLCCSISFQNILFDIKQATIYTEHINSSTSSDANSILIEYQRKFIYQSVFDAFCLVTLVILFILVYKNKFHFEKKDDAPISITKIVIALLVVTINLTTFITFAKLILKNVELYMQWNNILSWLYFFASAISCIFPIAYLIENKQEEKYAIRYTYEEYKTLREAKKAEKQRKKKEKLKKQLEEIEKAE